ncbi:hypothetical protein NDU88_005914 [Pleurodeles waltl]|uniref:Uncharacterized protein n=1 Tax=Pleurodeles waltl TaxID=8319 RepID=A0AAV7PH98_PLEWA|nr:hypothetical protein NDU88_005914 [Pleurodeles waltl]
MRRPCCCRVGIREQKGATVGAAGTNCLAVATSGPEDSDAERRAACFHWRRYMLASVRASAARRSTLLIVTEGLGRRRPRLQDIP